MYFYIILLNDNKYYIISSKRDNITIDEIMKITGIDWLLINRPLHIILKLYSTDPNVTVNKYVIEYMKKYGRQAVRGGSYTNVILTANQHIDITDSLPNMISDANNPIAYETNNNKSMDTVVDDQPRKVSCMEKIYKIICRKKYTIHEPLIDES